MRPRKKNKVEYTTQRVDVETLARIKKISFHLAKQGVRISQSDIIKYALMFSVCKEAELLDFIIRGEAKEPEGAFDTLVSITGKPWFPYGNLI
ncbi:MAG: hypothetical protein ABIH11_02665 [Candidatus Altiarchaeota archaeon]